MRDNWKSDKSEGQSKSLGPGPALQPVSPRHLQRYIQMLHNEVSSHWRETWMCACVCDCNSVTFDLSMSPPDRNPSNSAPQCDRQIPRRCFHFSARVQRQVWVKCSFHTRRQKTAAAIRSNRTKHVGSHRQSRGLHLPCTWGQRPSPHRDWWERFGPAEDPRSPTTTHPRCAWWTGRSR